jgi:hypothetical protein
VRCVQLSIRGTFTGPFETPQQEPSSTFRAPTSGKWKTARSRSSTATPASTSCSHNCFGCSEYFARELLGGRTGLTLKLASQERASWTPVLETNPSVTSPHIEECPQSILRLPCSATIVGLHRFFVVRGVDNLVWKGAQMEPQFFIQFFGTPSITMPDLGCRARLNRILVSKSRTVASEEMRNRRTL